MQVCRKQGLTETGLSKREEEILLAKFPNEETLRTNKEVADYLTDDNKICNTENVEVQMRTIYNERFCAENCKDPPDFQGEIGQKRDPLFQAWLKRKYREGVTTQGTEDSAIGATPAIASQPVWRHQFQTLIDNKTKDFVGRKYVFHGIAEFLENQPNGYLIIEGDPGMGKSAILAEYVRRTGCVAHFNVQQGGENRADEFIKSVCTQLIHRYQLPYLTLPPDATQDGVFLRKLLDEIAEKTNGDKVVIAVDALDEVDRTSYKADANILYLPPYLPEGIYFLMTRRRGFEMPFMAHTSQELFNLMHYQDRSLEDVRAYIQNRVNGSERLRQQIAKRGETEAEFIDKIATKSENNFMYLVYVLRDIEQGRYQDLSLEQFPQGLQGYYDFHFQDMGMYDKPLPEAKIKLVYILGEVRQPVSREKLCNFSGEDGRTVQSVLNEWMQFLHEYDQYSPRRYSVYHASFRDFLHRQDILEKTGVTIPGINQLIAKEQLNKWKNRRHHE